MNSVTREYLLYAGIAVAVTGGSVYLRSPSWFIAAGVLVLFAMTAWFSRNMTDRVFYLASSGLILVAVMGSMSPFAGLIVAWFLAGLLMTVTGYLESRQDRKNLGIFCAVTLAIAVMIELSNHVLIPIIILGAATFAIIMVQTIRGYQLRKSFTGSRL